MTFFVFLAFLGAFGLFCALWILFGGLLLCRRGWLLCPAAGEVPEFVPVYLWLRGMGIVQCPLILLDQGLPAPVKSSLREREIEIYTPAEFSDWLGTGEIQRD